MRTKIVKLWQARLAAVATLVAAIILLPARLAFAERSGRRHGLAALILGGLWSATPMVVAEAQTISVAASESFASTAATPNPAGQTLAVTNSGSTSMTGVTVPVTYATGEPTGWLQISNPYGSGFQLNAGSVANMTLSVLPGTLPAGTYHASIA